MIFSGIRRRTLEVSRLLPAFLALLLIGFFLASVAAIPLAARTAKPSPGTPSARFRIGTEPQITAGGDLDLSFGTGGTVITKIADSPSAIYDLVLQPDGKILTVGPGIGFSIVALARYNADGSLDQSFGKKGLADRVAVGFVPYVLALQPNGKIVVVGGSSNFNVARFNSDGSLDETFGNGGQVATDFFRHSAGASCVGIQEDGKIVVGGYVIQPGFGSWFALVRYKRNGELDASFGNAGVSLSNFSDPRAYDVALQSVGHLAIQSDGKIVAVGNALTYFTSYDFVVARYNSDGTPDSSFGSGGMVFTDFAGGHDTASQIVIQPDGRLVVAGGVVFTSPAHFDFGLARYNTDGSLDITFGGSGRVSTTFANHSERVWGLALQEDGRIVAAGEIYRPFSGYDFGVARYNIDGSLDSSFGNGGKVEKDFFGRWDSAFAIAIQEDGKIVAGGYAGSYAIDSGDCALVRYDAGTGPDFSLALSSSEITAVRGATLKVTLNIIRTLGFTGNVTVTAPGAIGAIKPKQSGSASTAGSTVKFKLKVTSSAPSGVYQLDFIGKDEAGRTRTATVTITVQ